MLRILSILISLIFISQSALAELGVSNLWQERKNTLLARATINENFVPLSPSSVKTTSNLPKIIKRTGPYANLISQIPQQFGSIRTIQSASQKATNRTIIHIQDVHANHEAQLNISHTLQKLIENGAVDLIGLEGTWGSIDLTRYHEFPVPETVAKVADMLLKENLITGPIHAGFLNRKRNIELIGIDSSKHYAANTEAVRDSSPLVEKTTQKIEQAQRNLSSQKASVLNLNLLHFDARVSAYNRDDLSITDYLSFLDQSSIENGSLVKAETPALHAFREAMAFESQLHFERVESERNQILSRLMEKLNENSIQELLDVSVAFRTGQISNSEFYEFLKNLCHNNGIELSRYSNMEAYIQYVLLTEKMDVEQLFKDLKQYEQAGYAALIKNGKERAVIEESHWLTLAQKLVKFELTPEEWSEYKKANIEYRFSNIDQGKFINNSLNAIRSSIFDIQGLESFENFYHQAELRDHAITANLLKAMDEKESKVAILVTGGFHSPGINQLMKEEKVGVLSFVPKITEIKNNGETKYLSVFTQEKTPLQKLFEGQKLFLGQNPAPAASIATADASVVTTQLAKPDPRINPAGIFSWLNKWQGWTVLDYKATATRVWIKVQTTTKVILKIAQFIVLGNPDKPTIDIEPTGRTNSSIANLFDGPLYPLNWILRIVFLPGIIVHELGHLIEGAFSSNRGDLVHIKPKHIVSHMPWSTKGIRSLWGLIANGLFIFLMDPILDRGYATIELSSLVLPFTDPLTLLLSPWLAINPLATWFFYANMLVPLAEFVLWPIFRYFGDSKWLGDKKGNDIYRLFSDVAFRRRFKFIASRFFPFIGFFPKVDRPYLKPDPALTDYHGQYRDPVQKGLKPLQGLRPRPGIVRVSRSFDNIPKYEGTQTKLYKVEDDVYWNTRGEIFLIEGEWMKDPMLVSDKVLRAGFIFQKWTHHPKKVTQENLEAWGRETIFLNNAFNSKNLDRMIELYKNQFRYQDTTATNEIKAMAKYYGLSEHEARRYLYPDWVYRVELEVPVYGPKGFPKLDKPTDPYPPGTTRTYVGWRSHYNSDLGPNKGGNRFDENLGIETVIDLSREMTPKAALFIPMGGAKAGMNFEDSDPDSIDINERALIMRGFIRQLREMGAIGPNLDIPAPDKKTFAELMAIGVDEWVYRRVLDGELNHPELVQLLRYREHIRETEYAKNLHFHDKYTELSNRGELDGDDLAILTGKPAERIKRNQIDTEGSGIDGRGEATARGVLLSVLYTIPHVYKKAVNPKNLQEGEYDPRQPLRDKKIAIHGFGNAGGFLAKLFREQGAIIISVSTSKGTVKWNGNESLDPADLEKHYNADKLQNYSNNGAVFKAEYDEGRKIGGLSALFMDEADIVLPAATQDVIDLDNYKRIGKKVRIIAEAANGPIVPEVVPELKREFPETVVLTDILANGGGVTVSFYEMLRNFKFLPMNIKAQQVRGILKKAMNPATRETIKMAKRWNVTVRQSAYRIAFGRILLKSPDRRVRWKVRWTNFKQLIKRVPSPKRIFVWTLMTTTILVIAAIALVIFGLVIIMLLTGSLPWLSSLSFKSVALVANVIGFSGLLGTVYIFRRSDSDPDFGERAYDSKASLEDIREEIYEAFGTRSPPMTAVSYAYKVRSMGIPAGARAAHEGKFNLAFHEQTQGELSRNQDDPYDVRDSKILHGILVGLQAYANASGKTLNVDNVQIALDSLNQTPDRGPKPAGPSNPFFDSFTLNWMVRTYHNKPHYFGNDSHPQFVKDMARILLYENIDEITITPLSEIDPYILFQKIPELGFPEELDQKLANNNIPLIDVFGLIYFTSEASLSDTAKLTPPEIELIKNKISELGLTHLWDKPLSDIRTWTGWKGTAAEFLLYSFTLHDLPGSIRQVGSEMPLLFGQLVTTPKAQLKEIFGVSDEQSEQLLNRTGDRGLKLEMSLDQLRRHIRKLKNKKLPKRSSATVYFFHPTTGDKKKKRDTVVFSPDAEPEELLEELNFAFGMKDPPLRAVEFAFLTRAMDLNPPDRSRERNRLNEALGGTRLYSAGTANIRATREMRNAEAVHGIIVGLQAYANATGETMTIKEIEKALALINIEKASDRSLSDRAPQTYDYEWLVNATRESRSFENQRMPSFFHLIARQIASYQKEQIYIAPLTEIDPFVLFLKIKDLGFIESLEDKLLEHDYPLADVFRLINVTDESLREDYDLSGAEILIIHIKINQLGLPATKDDKVHPMQWAGWEITTPAATLLRDAGLHLEPYRAFDEREPLLFGQLVTSSRDELEDIYGISPTGIDRWEVQARKNGLEIGMTVDQLRRHFWNLEVESRTRRKSKDPLNPRPPTTLILLIAAGLGLTIAAATIYAATSPGFVSLALNAIGTLPTTLAVIGNVSTAPASGLSMGTNFVVVGLGLLGMALAGVFYLTQLPPRLFHKYFTVLLRIDSNSAAQLRHELTYRIFGTHQPTQEMEEKFFHNLNSDAENLLTRGHSSYRYFYDDLQAALASNNDRFIRIVHVLLEHQDYIDRDYTYTLIRRETELGMAYTNIKKRPGITIPPPTSHTKELIPDIIKEELQLIDAQLISMRERAALFVQSTAQWKNDPDSRQEEARKTIVFLEDALPRIEQSLENLASYEVDTQFAKDYFQNFKSQVEIMAQRWALPSGTHDVNEGLKSIERNLEQIFAWSNEVRRTRGWRIKIRKTYTFSLIFISAGLGLASLVAPHAFLLLTQGALVVGAVFFAQKQFKPTPAESSAVAYTEGNPAGVLGPITKPALNDVTGQGSSVADESQVSILSFKAALRAIRAKQQTSASILIADPEMPARKIRRKLRSIRRARATSGKPIFIFTPDASKISPNWLDQRTVVFERGDLLTGRATDGTYTLPVHLIQETLAEKHRELTGVPEIYASNRVRLDKEGIAAGSFLDRAYYVIFNALNKAMVIRSLDLDAIEAAREALTHA